LFLGQDGVGAGAGKKQLEQARRVGGGDGIANCAFAMEIDAWHRVEVSTFKQNSALQKSTKQSR
jgi:hypothetical protein